MNNPQWSNATNSDLESNLTHNIILNHDFSRGLQSWNPIVCKGSVVTGESGFLKGVSANSGSNYVVLKNRYETWQGLGQDITSRVSPGSTYKVSAFVRVSKLLQGHAEVSATLRLEFENSSLNYFSIGRVKASDERWENLTGVFSLKRIPKRVVFYLEGPAPGVDLLIGSVVISSLVIVEHKNNLTHNIILNHDFSRGLQSWNPIVCKGSVLTGESGYLKGVSANSGSNYVVLKNRYETWQGLGQDITSRVSPGSTYKMSAFVRVSKLLQGHAEVSATLRLEFENSSLNYFSIGRVKASDEWWKNLTGTFSLKRIPKRVVFYLEGPAAGVDLLIASVVISSLVLVERERDLTHNIILNHDFSDVLQSWHHNNCDGIVVTGESNYPEGVSAKSGSNYVVITKRKETWQGLGQDITSRVLPRSTYKVSAFVRVSKLLQQHAEVFATLRLEFENSSINYMSIGRVKASNERWENLTGTFSLKTLPKRVVFYLEGPAPGVDLLIDSVVVYSAITVERKRDLAHNIILNHDFSDVLQSWHHNNCDGIVVTGDSNYPEGVSANSGSNFAVITKRKETWQGLEQDITGRVLPGSTYKVSAFVRVSKLLREPIEVLATLKLVSEDSSINYLSIGRVKASNERWENLTGTFSLKTIPKKIVFYLEGPAPDVDLLIDSVVISSPVIVEFEQKDFLTHNIILNHDFSDVLQSWHHNNCDGIVVTGESNYLEGVSAKSGSNYVVIMKRKETWQGLEQDITSRVSPGSTYKVSAFVRVSKLLQEHAEVFATLRLVFENSSIDYLSIGRVKASNERWENLIGTFSLKTIPKRVVFYLEGPAPGVDLLIDSVVVYSAIIVDHETAANIKLSTDGDETIIVNPLFEDGLNNWSGRGCKILVNHSIGFGDDKIAPVSGNCFARATERTHSWNGIQQDITERVQKKLSYEVTAVVRICGKYVTTAVVQATLWVQMQNQREQYICIANLQASDRDWAKLQGKFLLNASPSKAVIYLEGPPMGVEIFVDSFLVKRATKLLRPPPPSEDVLFGENIIENSSLSNGISSWAPLGECTLNVCVDSPLVLPPTARDSLGPDERLSGRYILVTNRKETWMGPSQIITHKVKLHSTYQVSAWVRIGSRVTTPQNINVVVGVDSEWVNGGQIEVRDDEWHEISGSFRIEKQPAKVMVYIQGPSPGVDLMVAGLHIFPVDRRARFKHLKTQTDKIRKRDVVMKFSGSNNRSLSGAVVKVKQTKNSFPFGSCISRSNIDNEDFVDFFVKNFNWAVFGNELKWYWTEPEQGKLNWEDADELLEFCKNHSINVRGHCIFSEVHTTVQSWVRSLSTIDLMKAVQNRVTSLLTRYKGKLKHYDVNNEMLHGFWYQDMLGKEIRSYMFKAANQIDPLATLFVNDYHVEDGCDARSSPDMYIQHILDLQEQGAPVGGIGIQGHIDFPIGPIICSALDKLATLGLPIWFTELDVASPNEHVRAEDLEVMLREAFAHPAVEGIVLWGFWELFMGRDNSHLVDAEGSINEAGKKYLELKEEWLSNAHGHINDEGEFRFRGFHGDYSVEIITESKKISKKFVVDEDSSAQVVAINL